MSIFFSSLLFCVVFILLLRNLSFRFDLVDHPTEYKHHILSTPTVGGPSMFLAAFLTLLFWNQPYTEKNFLLIICAGLIAILGMLDDRQSLGISLRMMIQVFLALIVVYFADGLITHLGRLVSEKEIDLGILAAPCSVIALVGSMNAVNMIDGIDGLAGKMVLISILGVSVIFYLTGVVENLPLTWALSGALVGFLLFNSRILFRHAWVFMGDSGSMWLGLLLGWLLIQVMHDTVPAEPALALWLFGIPLLDVLAVIFRRVKRNCSPFHGDRTHIHYMLADKGVSFKRILFILCAAQILLIGTGILFHLFHAPAGLIFWSFTITVSDLLLLLTQPLARLHIAIPCTSLSIVLSVIKNTRYDTVTIGRSATRLTYR